MFVDIIKAADLEYSTSLVHDGWWRGWHCSSVKPSYRRRCERDNDELATCD